MRVTNTVSSASSTLPMRKLATFSRGTSSGPSEMAPDSSSGAGNAIWTGLPARRLASSAEFWRIWPTANEDSSRATSGPPRSGRYAMRSMTSPMRMVPTSMISRGRQDGDTREAREHEQVDRDHHHVAVGEVDEPQDAEDERQPHGHHRVQAARAERVGALLEEVVDHRQTPR